MPLCDDISQKTISMNTAIPMDMYRILCNDCKYIKIECETDRFSLLQRNSVQKKDKEEEGELQSENGSEGRLGPSITITSTSSQPSSGSTAILPASDPVSKQKDPTVPTIKLDDEMFPLPANLARFGPSNSFYQTEISNFEMNSESSLQENPSNVEESVIEPTVDYSDNRSPETTGFRNSEDHTNKGSSNPNAFTAPSIPFSLVFEHEGSKPIIVNSSLEKTGVFDLYRDMGGKPEIVRVVCKSQSEEQQFLIPIMSREETETLSVHYRIRGREWEAYGLIPDENDVYPCIPFRICRRGEFNF